MSIRYARWTLLACAITLAACTSGGGGTSAGNTEMNVVVPNGSPSLGGGSSAPALIDIQTVEYTIACAGNTDTFLDNNASFPNAVRIDGNLEVADGRTRPQGPIPPEFGTPRPGDGAEIWQGFMDLPPGPCTVELRARDADGEVICTAQEPFTITADTVTKVNLVLICDLSFQAPVGSLDVDGTFSFNVGNFCPDLFVLNCLDSNPVEQQVLPPPNPPIAVTSCEVRFRDGDSTCGASCDPQSCTPTASGLSCTPGPDPGVSTTITCDAVTLLDCEGDGVPDASCTINGDTLGTTASNTPVACATDADCVAAIGPLPGIVCNTSTNTCDLSNTNPFVNASFFMACIPPALGGLPGVSPECTAITTDGDLDCDKTKVVSINCRGLAPCAQLGQDNGFSPDQAGGDATCQALLTTVCQSSVCDDAGGTAPATCVDSPVADGTDCSAELPPLAECQAGVCTSISCSTQPDPDASCNDANPCTFAAPGTCDLVTGLCGPLSNEPSGLACDAGAGPVSGACDGGGTCVDICSFNPACPDDAPSIPDNSVCTAATCDPVDGTCGQAPANNGGACDFFAVGGGLGFCSGGICLLGGVNCGTTSGVVQLGCTNGVTSAQSPFPNQMTVTVNEPVVAGQPFTADVSGIGAFPKFFLDAAQSTVPGGVRSAIVEGFNATAEAHNGTGQILLQAAPAGITPGLTRFCQYPSSTVCTADSDCLVPPCHAPVLVAGVPLSTDCGAGGFCEGIGQGTSNGPTAQCNITDPPSFCVSGDLLVPLFAPGGPQPMTAGAGPSDVVFNWAVDPVTITCPDPTT